MSYKNIDMWLERFERESGLKSSIIVYGNTTDIMFNQKNAKYETVIKCMADRLLSRGYKNIIKWDRVDGIDYTLISKCVIDDMSEPLSNNDKSNDYNVGYDEEFNINDGGKKLNDIEEFFSFLLKTIKGNSKKTAFILDYSDYIFGNANSLSEKERNWLSILGKALQEANAYNMLDEKFEDISNIIVLVTQKLSYIPPAFYLNNPMVSNINITVPGRAERENFVNNNYACLRLDKDLRANNAIKFNDFIDALDGFTIKDIAQIMKLSRQTSIESEPLSFEKLINIYKYGEKTSPWEELSKDKLTTIEDRLKDRVKGQDEAIETVKAVIIRAYTGFSGLQHSAKQKKPKGTLFFVGPTGVGKTELAKALAEFLFGDENACIRFDMSEFNHEHSDQRLVGAPPGYVGYEEGGQLTNAIKEKPFCVILFDEIEKAHGKILDKFLQILEDGRLTDGKGETVYFSESIIIFTSNIGAAKISSEQPAKEVKAEFINKVKEHFVMGLSRPELLNRIGDNIVAFNFIDDLEVFTEIAKIKFKTVENFVKERYKASLLFEDEKTSFKAIAEKAGIANGGRGILNIIEATLVNPLSSFIFENYDSIGAGSRIVIMQSSPKRAMFDFELK